MEPGACLDTLRNGRAISQPSLSVVLDSYQAGGLREAAETNAYIKELQPSIFVAADNDNENASLEPITPDSNRETLLSPPQYFASPLTLSQTFPTAICADSQFNDYPSSANVEALCTTPKDVLFDPFAPGPDVFLLAAPQCRKCRRASWANVVRQLTFDSSASYVDNTDTHHQTDAKTKIVEEEMSLFQTLYGNLLEVIISMQTKEIPSAKYPSNILVSDGFETPTSESRLCGVAETCPQAPIRPSRKFRDIHKGVCRKLEF